MNANEDIQARENAIDTERHAHITAIARELGGWAVAPCRRSEEQWVHACNHFDLTSADGITLYVNWDSYRKRLHISGKWPQVRQSATSYRDGTVQGISVSPTREPVAIAREIKRRYLAAFLPAFAKMNEHKEREESTRSAAAELVNKLREVFGQGPATGRNGMDVFDSRSAHIYHEGVSIDVRQHGSVQFEFSTSNPERALQVARFLATLPSEE